MSASTCVDQDAAHVAAFAASDDARAMIAHLSGDHGLPFVYGPASSHEPTLTLLRAMHASQHADSDHPHARAGHDCHHGPQCLPWHSTEHPEDGWCEHLSCQAIAYEPCDACQFAAMDGQGQFDPVMCAEHGWTYITDAGSNSGFAGEGFWWENWACGHGTAEGGEL